MRVAMYYNNHDVRVQDMPIPQIGPGELLVRVESSGICGSDVMEWYRVYKAPLVLGHEIAGTIIETGESITRYHKGDRITVAHHVPCNTCHYCRGGHHTACDTLRKTSIDPGGFAEYVRLPAINVERGVFLLPDHVSFEQATFTEPIACVLRGQRIADFQHGKSVLVMGCGMAGLLHVHLAHVMGAGNIVATDISDYRLNAAAQFGADITLHAQELTQDMLRKVNNGYLADLVMVCTGAASAMQQSLQLVERGGTILIFALTGPDVTLSIPVNDFFSRNEVTLTTSYAGSPADYTSALDLISNGTVTVDPMITHRLSLEETGKGIELVASAQDCLKVLIAPQR